MGVLGQVGCRLYIRPAVRADARWSRWNPPTRASFPPRIRGP